MRKIGFTMSPRSMLGTVLAVVFVSLVCLGGSAHGAPQRSPTRRAAATAHRAKAASGLTISKINDLNTADPITEGSQGESVVRAEILLDRIKFSPGEISTSYTDNLLKAVTAFQSANGLTATGNVDPMTWATLNAAQGNGEPAANAPAQPSRPSAPVQAIVRYVVTFEDVDGPFSKLPRVSGPNAGEKLMLREAKMNRLNYESALELLGEKFHASPALLRQLSPGKAFDRAGTEINVPNVGTPDPPQAASVLVDGLTKSVTAKDTTGKVLAFYPATLGSEHDPLPAGEWKIIEVTRYPHFKYNPNLFWDSENKHPRATLPPGPRNPVGVVWIGISKEHYGIHGTPNPAKIGATESHGCIRLTNWDALELSKIVGIGTPVIIKSADGP